MSDVVPIALDWPQFKGFVITYQTIIDYAPTGAFYFLRSSNGQIDLQSFITDPSDVHDFETNFKAQAFEVAISPGPSLGAVTVTNFPPSQPVSGTVAATQSGTWNVGLTGSPSVTVSGTVSVGNFPATQPISATALPLPSGAATSANQATAQTSLTTIAGSAVISLTDGQKTMAGSLPVVMASDQSALPISAASLPLPAGAATSANQTTGNTSLSTIASSAVVAVTAGQKAMAASLPVVVASDQSTLPISAASLPLPTGAATATNQATANTSLSTIATSPIIVQTNGQKVMASSLPVVVASDQSVIPATLGNSTGKTLVAMPGSLVTTSTAAGQVISTHTVTGGKTFYLEVFEFSGFPTTLPGNNNPLALGTVILESPVGTTLWSNVLNIGFITSRIVELPEPLPIPAGQVIRLSVTPAAATSTTWNGNMIAYER